MRLAFLAWLVLLQSCVPDPTDFPNEFEELSMFPHDFTFTNTLNDSLIISQAVTTIHPLDGDSDPFDVKFYFALEPEQLVLV